MGNGEEERYNGPERRRGIVCGFCSDHALVKKLFIENPVPTKTFHWMIGGIGVVLIFIFTLIVSIHSNIGDLKSKFGDLKSDISVEMGKRETKIGMLQQNQRDIIELQKTFTRYVLLNGKSNN